MQRKGETWVWVETVGVSFFDTWDFSMGKLFVTSEDREWEWPASNLSLKMESLMQTFANLVGALVSI